MPTRTPTPTSSVLRSQPGRGHAAMGHHGNDRGHMAHRGQHTGPASADPRHRSAMRQLTVATGYVALGLLALTLLIGTANLLFRSRNPISSYLSRGVGTWAAGSSLAHLVVGLQVHGSGRIRDWQNYFTAPMAAASGPMASVWPTGPVLPYWSSLCGCWRFPTTPL